MKTVNVMKTFKICGSFDLGRFSYGTAAKTILAGSCATGPQKIAKILPSLNILHPFTLSDPEWPSCEDTLISEQMDE